MRREKRTPYIWICFVLFCSLNVPDSISHKMRSLAVSSFAPSQSFLLAAIFPKKNTNVEKLLQEKESLHRENRALHEQIDPIRKWLLSEDRLEEQMQRIRSIDPLESEEKWKQIMLFGAILTIFISCIGLFGLATLSAEHAIYLRVCASGASPGATSVDDLHHGRRRDSFDVYVARS